MADATVTPSAVEVLAEPRSLAGGSDIELSLSSVSTVAAINAVTNAISVTAAPSAIAAGLVVPNLSWVGTEFSISAVGLSATIPSPTVLFDRTVTPSVVAVTVAVDVEEQQGFSPGYPGGEGRDGSIISADSRSSYTWDVLASLPAAKHGFGCAIDDDGIIYVVGGSSASGITPVNTASSFNQEDGTWTSIATISSARYCPAAVSVDTGVYIFGGRTSGAVSAVCQYFDPGSGSWSTLTSMSTARWNATAVKDSSGNIYVIGGWTNTAGTAASTAVEKYEPGVGWTTLASMPVGRALGSRPHDSQYLVDDNDYIYMVGGTEDNSVALDAVHRYDPVADEWVELGSLNTARFGHSVVRSKDGQLVAIGGIDGTDVLRTVEFYLPDDDAWTADIATYESDLLYDDLVSYETAGESSLMSYGRKNLDAVVTDDNKIIIFGGTDDDDLTVAVIEELHYYGSTWRWVSHAFAPTPATAVASSGVLVVDQNRIFAIGGLNVALDNVVSRVEMFGPSYVSENWDIEQPLPIAVFEGRVIVDSLNRIYYIGGSIPSAPGCTAQCFRYDPITRNWASIAQLNKARNGHRILRDSVGRIYAICGKGVDGSELASIERYDPTTNVWTELASPSVARISPSVGISSDDKIYVVGGYTAETLFTGLTSAERYSVSSNTWTTLPPMQEGHISERTNLIVDNSNRVHVFGGGYPGILGITSSKVETYNPGTGAWSSIDMPGGPRTSHGVTKLPSGNIMIFGGQGAILPTAFYDVFQAEATSNVTLFDPDARTFTDLAPMKNPRCSFGFTQTPNGLVYVAQGKSNQYYGQWTLENVEVYNFVTNTWSELSIAPNNVYIGSILMASDEVNRIFIIGGSILDPGAYELTQTSITSSFEKYGLLYDLGTVLAETVSAYTGVPSIVNTVSVTITPNQVVARADVKLSDTTTTIEPVKPHKATIHF